MSLVLALIFVSFIVPFSASSSSSSVQLCAAVLSIWRVLDAFGSCEWARSKHSLLVSRTIGWNCSGDAWIVVWTVSHGDGTRTSIERLHGRSGGPVDESCSRATIRTRCVDQHFLLNQILQSESKECCFTSQTSEVEGNYIIINRRRNGTVLIRTLWGVW